jgi:tape measure domain-containing protein
MLTIPVKLDLDAGAAEAALKNFERGAKDALQEIVELNGKKVNIDFKFSTSGDPVVKELNDQQAALKRVTDGYNKLTGGQAKSIGRTKKIIQQFKAQRDAAAVNSKEFKIAAAAVEKFEAELRGLQGVQKGSIADLKAQRQNLISLRDSVKVNSPEFRDLTRQITRLDKQLKKTKTGINSFVTAFAKIAVVSAGIQSVSAALRSVGNAVDVYVRRTKEVEGFNLALRNVGLSQQETSRIFNQAERTASALGAPLQQVEKSYRRMIPALKAVGTSAADSDKFIEAISARSQTLGLNTEQSGRLLEAFAQVLSKGKLQAEELNQQISELDGAFRTQLADALGVTTAQLTTMISKGEVTADVFVKAVNSMENGVEALRARVQESNLTIQQFQNTISIIDTKNIETIGKAIEPALKSFLAIRLAIADFITEFTKTAQFNNLVIVFNGLAKGLENFIKGLLGAITVLQKITAPIVSVINFVLNLGKEVGGLVGTLAELTIAFGLAKASMIAFAGAGGVVALLGKIKVAAIAASGALKALALSAAKVALPIFAVIKGVQLVSDAMDQGTKAGGEFDKALDDVDASMKSMEQSTNPAADAIIKFVKAALGLEAITASAAGFQIDGQISRIKNQAKAASNELKKLGASTNDLSSFTNVATDDLKNFLGAERNRSAAIKIGIETAERRMEVAKREGGSMGALLPKLDAQIKLLKEQETVNNNNISVAEKVLKARGENVEAIGNEEEALKKLKEASDLSLSENNIIAIKARTAAIKELGKETELLTAASLGIDQAQSEANLKVYENQLAQVREIAAAKEVASEEERKEILRLTELIAQEREKQAQLGIDAQNAINDALERGIQKAQELGEVSGGVASNLVGAFDGLAGNLTQGLSAATSLMDQLVAEEIKGLEVGSRMRQEIVLKQLRGQARANEIEHQIAKTKLRVQNMIAVSEAKIAALRLRAEAEVARARGQQGLANALEEAANMQGMVVQGLQRQFEISSAVLDIEKRKKDQALIRKGLDEKITNNQSKMGRILGVQRTTTNDTFKILKKMTDESDDLLDDFANSAENAQQMKEDANKVAIEKGATEAEKIADAFENGADAARRMKQELSDVATLASRVSAIIGSGTSNPARAMGGPVQGGSSYFVNDGGGREGFLSNSGNFSMLPAARNINWTAPTSGTVIPANLVGRYQQALAANQSVTSRTSVQPASKGVDRVSASIDSGSLVQRMAAVMSGNGGDQRITNHVTIQSQEPVTDASKIMTNVARMKLRKGGRF